MSQIIEFKYKKFDKNIVTLKQMRLRAIMNALCSTKSVSKASLSLGIPESTIWEFMKRYGIKNKHLKEMRKDYKLKFKRNGSNIKNLNTEKK